MKFLVDVNIPQSIIIHLIKSGHDVLDVKKRNPRFSDLDLVQLAKREARIIITRDKDFIVLMQFPKYHVGTIAIRVKTQTPQFMKERLCTVLNETPEEVCQKSLTIIKEATYKVDFYSN